MSGRSVWVVIHIARNEERARRIEHALQDEGLMVRVRAAYGDADGGYEIAVLKSEAVDAGRLIAERGLL